MSEFSVLITIAGGFVAGCINTLAGNGSVVTLGLLIELLGMPGPVANGTNRLGVVGQGIFGIEPFIRHKKLPGAWSVKYILCGIAGAIIGAWVAIHSSAEEFIVVYKYLVLALLVYILYRSQINRSVREYLHTTAMSPWVNIPLFLAFGFYGGYIQMGMGLFLLAVLLFHIHLDILTANALKIIMVTVYTGIAIPLFHYYGLINWKVGILLFIGQAIGGWVTAQWANRISNAEIWAYRFLICIMAATLLKLFIYDTLFSAL